MQDTQVSSRDLQLLSFSKLMVLPAFLCGILRMYEDRSPGSTAHVPQSSHVVCVPVGDQDSSNRATGMEEYLFRLGSSVYYDISIRGMQYVSIHAKAVHG